jgi:hypothetical protein
VDLINSRDWFLQSIIETVVAHGVEIGVTLTVGGTTISGMLISGQKYFDELADALKKSSAEEGDIHSVLADGWRHMKAVYEKPEGASDDWTPPQAGFVHLKNAFIFANGGPPMPGNQGLLWRGNLASVDGFAIGNMSAQDT